MGLEFIYWIKAKILLILCRRRLWCLKLFKNILKDNMGGNSEAEYQAVGSK